MKDETKVLVWAGAAVLAFHALLFLIGWRFQRQRGGESSTPPLNVGLHTTAGLPPGAQNLTGN